MENLINTAEKSILLNIANKMIEAQQELDEFAVQLSLGKAEASEKFDEIKKEFAARLASLKQLIKANHAEGVLEELRVKLSALESELGSGKTETKASFELQRKKILATILVFEDTVKSTITDNDVIHDAVIELEKFKLKLEILQLKFELKKFEIKDGFRSEMKVAREKINGIMEAARNKVNKTKEAYTGFKEEILESYRHIQKALKKI